MDISSTEGAEVETILGAGDSAGLPQFNEPTFSDLDYGESCGFWMGEHYVAIEVSECELVDPRIVSTVPFEPDKVHEIRLEDLIFGIP